MLIEDDNPAPSRTRQVMVLVLVNVMVAFFQHQWGPVPMKFGFVPADHTAYGWLTSLFLHGSASHLASNMFALWIFGDNVAARLRNMFLPFYIMGGAAGAFAYYLSHAYSQVPVIGASGAVCAVIGCYAVLFPNARLKFASPIFRSLGQVEIFRYNVSALLFAGFYFITEYMASGGATKIAHDAHVGGFAFGAMVGMLQRFTAPAQRTVSDEDLRDDVAIEEERQDARKVDSLLMEGERELAVQEYIAAARQGEMLNWAPERELSIIELLREFGFRHVGRSAFNRFLKRNPDGPLAAQACLALGALEQDYFRDHARAARVFERAGGHPAATLEVKAEVAKRLALSKQVLAKTFASQPRAGQRYAVILEDDVSFDAREDDVIDAALKAAQAKPATAVGFLLENASAEQAATAAQKLEEGSVPVALVPMSEILSVPEPQLCRGMTAGIEGVTLALGNGQVERIPWGHCLFLAAAALPLGESSKRYPGIFELQLESLGEVYLNGTDYEKEAGLLFVFDVFAHNPPALYRWIGSAELESAPGSHQKFFSALREVGLNAVNVPVNEGVEMAFDGELPASCRFQSLERLNGYYFWQLQLARLRRSGFYEPDAKTTR